MKNKFLVLIMALIMVIGVSSQAYADTGIKDNKMSNLAYEEMYKTQDEIDEKYDNSQKIITYSSTLKKEHKKDEISAAYKAVQDEENYIVNLINRIDANSNTTLSNWEYNLKWLKKNYELLKNYKNEEINFKHVDSYIEAYEFVLLDKNTPDEKEISHNSFKTFSSSLDAATYSSSYSPSDAIEYAETYYSDYNSNYPDWTSYGGDCANFVSQCLYAGGKSMKNGSATNFSNWFSYGSSEDKDNVSSTWRGADAFKHYWKANSTRYKKFTSFDGAYAYGWKGDAVTLLNSNGRGWHTMLIVGYDNGDLVYSSHTTDRIDGSLEWATDDTDFIIYNID